MPNQKNKQKLDTKLSTYASSAKAACGRAGNWAAYAAVTGSALAMATSASASIISYSGAPVTVTGSSAGNPTPHQSVVLGTGIPKFFLGANGTHGRPVGSVLAGNGVFTTQIHFQILGEFGGAPLALDLSAGTVGPKRTSFLPGLPGVLAYKFGSGTQGLWASGQEGFEGLRFSAGNGYEYGWAELSWSGNGYPNSVTLHAAAFDTTPGEAITVGETSAPKPGTPEPGTAGLMLLALGAAGVSVIRKNSKQAA